MARRKHKEEGHENAERWLLTYADMITLLMAFFIMLYSMSQLDLKKFAMMAGSVRAELGGTGVMEGSRGVGTGAALGTDAAGIAPTLGSRPVAELKHSVERSLGGASKSAGAEVSQSGENVTVRLPASVLIFPAGSAELTPTTQKLLRRMVATLAKRPCRVKVTGHSCNLSPRSGQYASNWELSADRARNVALFLVRRGAVRPENCSFMGAADTMPLVANDSEANRVRNRRVEITITPLVKQAAPVTGAVPKTEPEEQAQSDGDSPLKTEVSPPPVDLHTPLDSKEKH